MLFEIVHRTDYRYGHPATEACVEARLTPPALPSQEILSQTVEFIPAAKATEYQDVYGNRVTFASIALRHETFSVVNRLTVRTSKRPLPEEVLDLTVAEARQIFASQLTDIFDYLQPSPAVPTGGPARDWATRFFAGRATLRESLEALNAAIYQRFKYRPGSTANSTPLRQVWKNREGVCQDFAHIMLSVLRTSGLPSRYICGYIEATAPEGGGLVGAIATHAWVEVLLPGGAWVALDPTNHQWCGEQHVTVATGRDFNDAAPVRGIFKGSGAQRMKVRVTVKRLKPKD